MAKEYTLKIYPPGLSREIYRVMRIPGDETLDQLCGAILDSFDFIDEHLYEFCMDNRMYGGCSYQSDPEYTGGPSTDIELDRLELSKGQNFMLHYDFGDDWVFTLNVQKILPETELRRAEIIKRAGEIEQYGIWDEDDEEWDEEDE